MPSGPRPGSMIPPRGWSSRVPSSIRTRRSARPRSIRRASRRDRETVPTLVQLLAIPRSRIDAPPPRHWGESAISRPCPPAGGRRKRPGDRILEHSLTYALIEIGDPKATAAGLESAEPRDDARRIVALDQMDGGRLDPKFVAGVAGLGRPGTARRRHHGSSAATANGPATWRASWASGWRRGRTSRPPSGPSWSDSSAGSQGGADPGAPGRPGCATPRPRASAAERLAGHGLVGPEGERCRRRGSSALAARWRGAPTPGCSRRPWRRPGALPMTRDTASGPAPRLLRSIAASAEAAGRAPARRPRRSARRPRSKSDRPLFAFLRRKLDREQPGAAARRPPTS